MIAPRTTPQIQLGGKPIDQANEQAGIHSFRDGIVGGIVLSLLLKSRTVRLTLFISWNSFAR